MFGLQWPQLRTIYHDAKTAAAKTPEMAGGKIKSVCDIDCCLDRSRTDRTHRIKPNRPALLKRLQKVADASRNGEVSDDKSHKFAGTLENAMPYILTFIGHLGMEGDNNNACEGITWDCRKAARHTTYTFEPARR